jgi:hypothetical protein
MINPRRSPFPLTLVALTLALGLTGLGAPVRAAVPDEVFAALLNRPVVLDLADGANQRGRLLAATRVAVVVERPDGQVVSVPRAGVDRIRTSPRGAEAERPEPATRRDGSRRLLVRSVEGPVEGSHTDSTSETNARQARRARLARSIRAHRALQIRRADRLYNAGMGVALTGVGMIVVAGVLHGVAANRTCWTDACAYQSTQMGMAALGLYITGPLVAAVGIPMWIVGGVKGASLRERLMLQDPHHLRFEAAGLTAALPPSRGAFSWQFQF